MSKNRPLVLYVLLILILFLAFGGLYGGAILVKDPSGQLPQLDIKFIQQTFFRNYLWPVVILLIFNGLFPLFVSIGLIKERWLLWPEKLNTFKTRKWPWAFSLYAGIILLAWIMIQLMIIGYIGILQVWLAIIGITILMLTLTPTIKNYFKK